MANRWTWTTPRSLQGVSLVLAGLGAVALLVAALTVPMYQGQTVDSNGTATSRSETLVAANGGAVMAVVAVPLAITVLVSCLLLMSRQAWALWVAGALTSAMAFFNLLAMLTIGVFVLPITAALVVACVCGLLIPRPSATSRRHLDQASPP